VRRIAAALALVVALAAAPSLGAQALDPTATEALAPIPPGSPRR